MSARIALALCLALAPQGDPPETVLPVDREALQVLHMQWLTALPGREQELADFTSRMRFHAQAHYEDIHFRAFRLRFRTEPEVIVLFSRHESFYDQSAARRTLGADEAWLGMSQNMQEAVDAKQSWRGSLFWVGAAHPKEELPDGRHVFRARAGALRRPVAQRSLVAIAEHLNATYEGVVASVFSAPLKEPELAFLFIDYYTTPTSREHGLVNWELVRAQLLQDDKYLELVERADQQFDLIEDFTLLF